MGGGEGEGARVGARTTSVGYVCMAMGPDEKFYVLLGKEREVRGWANGSNLWSTFSGRLERDEEPPIGAAREFLEESLCSVQLEPEMPQSPRALASFVDRVRVGTVQGKASACRCLLYVVVVPYDEGAPTRFLATRRRIDQLASIERRFAGEKRRCSDVPSLCVPGTVLAPGLIVASVRIHMSHVCVSIYDGLCLSEHTFHLGDVHLSSVQRVIDAWESFVNDLRTVPEEVLRHPAVKCVKVFGRIVDVRVNMSFLEKSEIDWWPLDTLRVATPNNSSVCANFRPHFVRILPGIVAVADSVASGKCQGATPLRFDADPSCSDGLIATVDNVPRHVRRSDCSLKG